MAQDDAEGEEEVEEEFSWTSPLGLFCAASICLGFCVPCVGLLCYMCSNRDMKPLNAQVSEAEAKATLKRDQRQKNVSLMLKYGEKTSINMMLSGKSGQVYSSENPIIGVVKVNVSDWVLKASSIKVVLLRKDLGHKVAPKKDMFGNAQEGQTVQYHYHTTKEVCSTTVTEFENMLVHVGQHQF